MEELENFTKSNPKSADANFLLGYHYQTTGYKEQASKYFAAALELLPGDKLLTQLVSMSPAAAKNTKATPLAPPPPR